MLLADFNYRFSLWVQLRAYQSTQEWHAVLPTQLRHVRNALQGGMKFLRRCHCGYCHWSVPCIAMQTIYFL